MMNSRGIFYSVVVFNEHKKIRTINSKRTKYLRSVPQESNTGGKINGKIYIHCSLDLAALELSWCALSRFIPLQGCYLTGGVVA
jgi:hypothetical protein